MGSESKTVFVVDDDEMILQLSLRLFQSSPYVAHVFNSALECLAAVSTEVPDCIVSDLQMPGMDGVQLIDQLREQGLAIPVIIATSTIGPSILRDQARRAGAYRILSKPHSRFELLEAIAEAVAGTARSETDEAHGRDPASPENGQDKSA